MFRTSGDERYGAGAESVSHPALKASRNRRFRPGRSLIDVVDLEPEALS
jgi:hypothetical protein